MNPIKIYSQHSFPPLRSVHHRALLVMVFLILLYVFRYNILTLFYICQTYLTWSQSIPSVIGAKDQFDPTMLSYPANQTSAGGNYTDLVPAILHHIIIGDIDLSKRPSWLLAREACLQWHPQYEHRYWNDSSAEALIREDYPWFLDAWKNYPYPIQRADSLRYLVLYRYGGIFLDMDLHCRRSLGPLRRFEFVSPAAYPVGISNGFLMASARHPFIKSLVDQLPLFNRNFLLPYATVMFSTGCMYVSALFTLYPDQQRLRILDYDRHRLSGHVTTPLFQHHGSSSWHSNDASFIKCANNILKVLYRHRTLLFVLFCLSLVALFFLMNRRRRRQRDKLDDALL